MIKEKKDILFLCQYFYPEYVSSATLPFDTAEALVKAGFRVGVMCGYPKDYILSDNVPQTEVHKGIRIKRLKYLHLNRSNFLGRLVNFFSFVAAVGLRFSYFKNYRSVIVYSNPPILPLMAVLAKKVFGLNIVFVSYDVYPEIAIASGMLSKKGLISRTMKFVNKILYKNVSRVVSLSTEMKNFLAKNRKNLSVKKISVIPNWHEDINEQEFPPSSTDKLFGFSKVDDRIVISYFGNMGTAQDADTILAAIRNFHDDDRVKFVFAGHGNKLDYLKRTVKAEKLANVRVLGFLHDKDFYKALSLSDSFIVSLNKSLTGLAVPSKTYSYMMAGKPIIAIMGKESDIARDLLKNNAGYVLESGDVSKLAGIINELKNDRDKREEMGRNCRNVFLKKYTKEICTSQYVKMMKELLEGN